MTRSVSTAIALTLGLAVSAAVAATVFAQKKEPSSASQTQVQSSQSSTGDAAEPQTSGEGERNSIRSGSLSISATPRTNPNTVKEDKLPEIEVDSSNIRKIAKSSVQPFRESRREVRITSSLPDTSLAAKIAGPNTETVDVWRPAFASQGFRGARLDAFAISPDGSVLAIAERTGTSNGPNGTRIVLINTSNWQVIRIFTTDRMLKKLAFDPACETLAAIAYSQPALKQDFGLLQFDLHTGDAVSFLKLPFPFNETIPPEQIALLVGTDGVFCSGFFGSKVFFISHGADTSAEVPYSTLETVSPASALSITPDGRSVAAASLKAIEFFTNYATPNPRRSVTTLDLGWTPVDIHFLGGAQTDFILCPAYQEDSPPVIMRSSAKESLDGRSAGYAVPMNSGKQIGVAFKVKGRIDIIDPASLEAVDSVILEQLNPATTGDAAFVFFLDSIGAFCVIDSNGNCYAAGKLDGAKRWSKRIIWNGGGKR